VRERAAQLRDAAIDADQRGVHPRAQLPWQFEMWHCPHCGAPQAETARCWVCRRSSTTCSTCLNFRRALAGDLGYCALDPKRQPLTGRELRGCWVERPSVAEAPKPPPTVPLHRLRPGGVIGPAQRPAPIASPPPRGFVFVDLAAGRPASEGSEEPAQGEQPEPPQPFLTAESEEDWAERTSLFGDPGG
jgi:hypothetical protein